MFEVGREKRVFATGKLGEYDPSCFILKGWVKILPFVNKRREKLSLEISSLFSDGYIRGYCEPNCPQLGNKN